MLQVGILGFGGMGHYHASVYARRRDARIAAVADIDPAKLTGQSMQINLGASGSADLGSAHVYASGDEMLASERLDVLSICLPTDLHAAYAVKALQRGIHVLCEKPMSRTLAEADAVAGAALRANRLLMVGQCLRFWPCYEKVAEAHGSGEYGRLLMLSMRRLSGPPGWAGGKSWFRDGARSGGCLLDMHIHDTDFVNHLLGTPEAVIAIGRSQVSGAIDNSFTQYLFPQGPIVMAESSWCYGGGFTMAFCAVFEKATLEMGYRSNDLILLRPGAQPGKVDLEAGSGYDREIDYFLACVRDGQPVRRCTPESTRATMRIALAEEQSALAGGSRVALD